MRDGLCVETTVGWGTLGQLAVDKLEWTRSSRATIGRRGTQSLERQLTRVRPGAERLTSAATCGDETDRGSTGFWSVARSPVRHAAPGWGGPRPGRDQHVLAGLARACTRGIWRESRVVINCTRRAQSDLSSSTSFPCVCTITYLHLLIFVELTLRNGLTLRKC